MKKLPNASGTTSNADSRDASSLLPNVYVVSFVILFAGALSYSLTQIFGWAFFALFLLMALPTLFAALAVAALALLRSARSFRAGRWIAGVRHLAAIPIAVTFLALGLISGPALALVFVAPRLDAALANYRKGIDPANENIEIISADPEVAAYRTAYIPGFAAPGWTRFVILDTTGRFAELSRQGRARVLAGSDQLKSRQYRAYCRPTLTHWIGSYYYGSSYDVEPCDPD